MLSGLNSAQYVQNYTNEEDQATSRIKVIIFVKITADEEYVTESLLDIERNFGSDLAIVVSNELTINTTFRSVPKNANAGN